MNEYQALRRWLRGQRQGGVGRVWHRAQTLRWWQVLGGACAPVNAYWALYWMAQGRWVPCVMSSCGAVLGVWAVWAPRPRWLWGVWGMTLVGWVVSVGLLLLREGR